jgi:hypothetical protein
MKLSYVIDNQAHVLAGILKDLLSEHAGRSLDVVTAYFPPSQVLVRGTFLT